MTRRRLLAAVALAVVGWLGLCGMLLLGAKSDASRGLAAVNAAKKLTAPDDLLAGAPVRPLGAARSAFRSAHRRLSHPLLAPLKAVPVAGRQLRAAEAMAGAASQVADVGADSVDEARAALQLPHGNGAERIALLRRLHDVAARASSRLDPIRLGPSKALIGPISERRAELDDKLGSIRRGLRDGAVASAGLADLLGGPRRYLVLAANNAEMRAGSGEFLSAGELTINNGELTLGPLRWTGAIKVPDEVAPPIGDADFAARWGFLNPHHEWRNLGASPRFPASAQLAARMWPAIGGAQVDGVLALDPVALQALLKATGPVEVGGRSINADNVVGLLLHEQYAGLSAGGGAFDVAQAARREELGQIARSVIERLSTGPFEVGALAGALADAARGRHLLAWSSKPGDQAAWEGSGIDGSLSRDSLMVGLLNRGGNKLDWFTPVTADLKVAKDGRSTLTVTMKNNTPAGQNVYVEGPYPGSGAAGGDYIGILSVVLPIFAADAQIEGFDRYAAAGPDGPAQVAAVGPVTVKRGETTTVTVRFRMAHKGSLTIEPSARVPAIKWTVNGRVLYDDQPQKVTWG
ncbi:MAG TPA: DUF4012 domain-containing protein [Acidimicrobiales bacterium]|nr:DUF4012 domain-containing protein [Acidimicrobiales bacterium]